jgi:hypothetical protein
MGGEPVPCQMKTGSEALLWALHAIEDPLSKVLLRLITYGGTGQEARLSQ